MLEWTIHILFYFVIWSLNTHITYTLHFTLNGWFFVLFVHFFFVSSFSVFVYSFDIGTKSRNLARIHTIFFYYFFASLCILCVFHSHVKKREKKKTKSFAFLYYKFIRYNKFTFQRLTHTLHTLFLLLLGIDRLSVKYTINKKSKTINSVWTMLNEAVV